MVVGKLLSKLPSAAPVADGNLARDQRLFGACWNTIHPILEWIRPFWGSGQVLSPKLNRACCAGLKNSLRMHTEYAYYAGMAVREGLLSLLVEGPRHGYQLKSEFEALTGGVWPLNVGQVYSTLDRLERDGLVITNESDGQKTYAITPVGVEVLGDWWETTPADEPPARDELILKVLMAVGSGDDHALSVVTQQRTAVVEMLQRRRRLNKQRNRNGARSGDGLAADLMTDALVVRAEADLRWLEMCEARLLQQSSTETRRS